MRIREKCTHELTRGSHWNDYVGLCYVSVYLEDTLRLSLAQKKKFRRNFTEYLGHRLTGAKGEPFPNPCHSQTRPPTFQFFLPLFSF